MVQARNARMKKSYNLISFWVSKLGEISEGVSSVSELYEEYMSANPDWNENESRMFNEIDNLLDNLQSLVSMYADFLGSNISKSTKTDRLRRINKLSGFTKEDEEDEEDKEDDDIEIEVGDKEIEIEDKEDDDIEESCKSRKSARANKKRVKMKKGEDMPEDADEQKNIKQTSCKGVAKSRPIHKKARDRPLAPPVVRKFSVTNGGQPNQDSYLGRYQQSPMVRSAIDARFVKKSKK